MNDGGSSISGTFDGGYIVAGWSESVDGDIHGHHGNSAFADALVVRYTADGDTLWTKSLGGTRDDVPDEILQTPDSGFIMVCFSQSFDGDVTGHHGSGSTWDIWVVKLDPSGNITWEKSFGGTSQEYGLGLDIVGNSGYIVAGSARSTDGDVWGNLGGADFWVLRLDLNGDTIWTRSYGGTGYEYAEDIKTTNDGGFIVVGECESSNGDVSENFGSQDYWVVKLDSVGTIQWEKSYGGSSFEVPYDVEQTADGGYIVGGYTYSNDKYVHGAHGNNDYWIVRLNNIGDTLWTKALGGSGSDKAFDLFEYCDGSFTITGYSLSNDGDVTDHNGSVDSTDIWNVNLDANGNINWAESIGGSRPDEGAAIYLASDGYYVTSGYSKSLDSNATVNKGGYDQWVVKQFANRTIPSICMVTVDSTSTKNVIVWDKTGMANIDSFRIYRDIIGIYTYVGSVDYNSLSYFTDTTNGVNPNTSPYRYKMTSLDSCGNESDFSTFHKTILLQVSLGVPPAMNLDWDDYLGFNYTFYRVFRDTTNQDNWIKIDSLGIGLTSLIDNPVPSTFLRYLVEVVPPSVCVADKAKNFNSSKSNSTSVSAPEALAATSTATMTSAPGVCDGTATVTATDGTTPYTYLWDGGTGFQATMTAVGLCAGTYTVTVTDAAGDTITSTVTVDDPVGIEQSLLEKSFNISPNPTSGKSYIEFTRLEENLMLEIYDLLGRNVYSTIVRAKRSILDLSGQPKGVYHLKISSKSGSFIRKIVIE
ncbi:MAG TPA: T9SS type A sorting domain-containing protein [Flavobacteriales bacterium]|nr:T9SS type A sorting domain-containing protein [Flavobacteriales bacterium]